MSKSASGEGYPGVDRLQYFLSKLGMIIAAVFVATTFGPNSPAMKLLAFALMVGSFVLDVMRLRNIGVSQWFALLRLLPFGNTVLDIGLQCAQTGWIETRRLDRDGKMIFAFELALVALMIFMILRFRFAAPMFF